MELKCLDAYNAAPNIFMKVGQSTADFDLSEETKAQMLADYPDKFEVVTEVKPTTAEVISEGKVTKKGK